MLILFGEAAIAAEVVPEDISPAQAAAWEKNNFDNPQAYSIEVDSPSGVNYTHGIDLSVVVFNNAGWNKLQNVADQFQRVAEIYSRCQIKITDIKMVVVDNGVNSVTEHETEFVAKRTPAYFKRPTLYFASQVSDEHKAYAWSGAEGCKDRPFSCNTAWIGSMVLTQRYKEGRKASYNVVAHELAHIVGDYDHTKGIDGNILGEYQEGGASITKEQCRKFKTFSEMNEL